MDFFEQLDSISILERNSNRIEGMQMAQARKMIRLYKQAREEIKVKLLMTPDNTFTEAKLELALLQIEDGIRTLNMRLKKEIATSQADFTDQGAEDSAKEVNSFEKHFQGVSIALPIDAIVESIDKDTFLFNQFQTSIETYNQGLRNKFQNVLGQNLLQQKTWSQSVYDMEQVFTAEEWVLARIVRTELHNIYGVSKNKGFLNIRDNYLPDLKKTLFHPMDSRTGSDSKQAAKKEMIVDLDEPFRYTFWQGLKKIERVFMNPPDRSNDRSILIPYRNSYDK